MNKRPVKIGLSTLQPMTYNQALHYANRTMPSDLKNANFKPSIFISNLDVNGSLFYRINWGK